MPHPFDATTKEMIEADPFGWVQWLGFSGDSAEVIDADISTISGDADKVIKVHDISPYILHIELQSRYYRDLPWHVHRTNVIISYRQKMVVESVVMLLRPEADGPEMTGTLISGRPGQRPVDTFNYQIHRVWQIPARQFLEGSLALLPLAPIADVGADELPAIIHKMKERINHEASLEDTKTFWTAVYVLLGLRFNPEVIEVLLKGIIGMEDSTTYQLIVAKGKAEGKAEGEVKGRAEEARRMIKLIGSKRFGEPSAKVTLILDQMELIEKLEQLSGRLLEVETWDEFLTG